MINKPTVLIIDDELIIRQLLSFSLEEDYEVAIAETGQLGIDIAMQTPLPELILLDILMPDVDGYEVIKQLKTCPDTQHIPQGNRV